MAPFKRPEPVRKGCPCVPCLAALSWTSSCHVIFTDIRPAHRLKGQTSSNLDVGRRGAPSSHDPGF